METAMLAALRFILSTAYFFLRERTVFRPASKAAPTARSAAWLQTVREQGFVVVPAFKDSQWCESAARELQSALETDSATKTGEDERVFGIEKLSPAAASFCLDEEMRGMVSAYAGGDERLLFGMANRVVHRDGAVYGSGGEWHRDSFKHGLKTLLYLTDVTQSDAPFCLIERSHRTGQIISDSALAVRRLLSGTLRGIQPTRLKDMGDALASRKHVFTASSGTLIIFDTSAIHAGMPALPGGKRLAVTNYYARAADAPAALAYYRKYVRLN
jgi:hypothetical protein